MPEISRFYGMLRVKDVDYQGDYRLALTFSDGAHKVVDLEPLLHGEVFGYEIGQ